MGFQAADKVIPNICYLDALSDGELTTHKSFLLHFWTDPLGLFIYPVSMSLAFALIHGAPRMLPLHCDTAEV